MNNARRPRICKRRKWWIPVSRSTFLEYIFCNVCCKVAAKALIKPITSNDISVKDAMATPAIIGTKDK